MCEKKKIDRATIIYKIFLIIMIASQIYPLVFVLFPPEGMLIHGILVIYLIFRFYMLNRMKNEAMKLDLTLTEFLTERSTSRGCSDTPTCPTCGGKCS